MESRIIYKGLNYIEFQAESSVEITENMAIQAQIKLGYDPDMHDFYSFEVSKCPVLFRYKATWSCCCLASND